MFIAPALPAVAWIPLLPCSWIASAALAATACGCGGTPLGTPGELAQACYGNGTCNDGLACIGGVCVAAPDSGSGSSSGSASSSDSGLDSGSWSPVCPADVPAIGSACSDERLMCEYGDAWWNISCDTVVACSLGHWITGAVSTSSCLPEPGPNAAACPTNAATINSDTSCPMSGLICNYGQGTSCSCVGRDSGPVWGCQPDPGCPGTRPRLGSYCNTSIICVYDCSYTDQCAGGIWQATPGNCGP